MLFRQKRVRYILLVISLSVVILFGLIFWQGLMVAQAQILKVQESVVQEPTRDLSSDFSFQKYLSAQTPFEDPNYVPADLLPIDSSFTANSSKRFSLREEAGIQFADMARHFWNDFKGDKLWIASAYRSADSQNRLFKKGCSAAKCAQVGASEHQAGLAIDIKVISKSGKGYSLYSGSKYYQWFADNAHLYGFHNTYQKGIEVDGQMAEGRHRRYVGTGLATQLVQSGMTFGEFFKVVSSNKYQVASIQDIAQ